MLYRTIGVLDPDCLRLVKTQLPRISSRSSFLRIDPQVVLGVGGRRPGTGRLVGESAAEFGAGPSLGRAWCLTSCQVSRSSNLGETHHNALHCGPKISRVSIHPVRMSRYHICHASTRVACCSRTGQCLRSAQVVASVTQQRRRVSARERSRPPSVSRLIYLPTLFVYPVAMESSHKYYALVVEQPWSRPHVSQP